MTKVEYMMLYRANPITLEELNAAGELGWILSAIDAIVLDYKPEQKLSESNMQNCYIFHRQR